MTLEIPHIIKYMGSKRKILEFIVDSIESLNPQPDQRLYDIFGGTAVVSASFREKLPCTCSDIQSYTTVLAQTYLQNYSWNLFPENLIDKIIDEVEEIVNSVKRSNPILNYNYSQELNLNETYKIQFEERNLRNEVFEHEYHLFLKFYSGTYWSSEQCLYIDAFSQVARKPIYRQSFVYNVILSSLMFSMAYTTQSTGHYAQYRELTEDNLKDILFYRCKDVVQLFRNKFDSLRSYYNGENNHNFDHQTNIGDYSDILQNLENNSIVYADPPYQFVHYSRFYHTLETLVRYDYPEIKYKGRYRDDRHQSPFCIKSKVSGAFDSLFHFVNNANSSLVLSYSNNGMITLDDLLGKAHHFLNNQYQIRVEKIDHIHSTMGRQGDKSRNVDEAVIICNINN